MTELTKKEIRDSAKLFKGKFASAYSGQVIELIQQKVAEYNEFKLDGEPEMTFDEMAELLQEKLTTYRGKI
jgi:hypothetical protein